MHSSDVLTMWSDIRHINISKYMIKSPVTFIPKI